MKSRTPSAAKTRPVLPEPYFLEQLHIERLRAERSGSALSLILIDPGQDRTLEEGEGAALLSLLPDCTRISDRTGIMGSGLIALLLPDTGSVGARQVADHLHQTAAGLFAGLRTATFPDQVFEHLLARLTPDPALMPFLQGDETRPRPWATSAKRVMDLVGSLAGLVLLSPVMVLIALGIRLTSEGPVIFRQQRLGKGGIPFTLYKFRSLYQDSDEALHRDFVSQYIRDRLPETTQGDGTPKPYKLQHDPRITPLGRWLRRSSLDELPQLFNILRGDMSLVGPRPAIRYEAREYQAWHLRRILSMKPGLTGLWQVEGRSSTRFDDMVRLDIRYIQQWSLGLDMKILCRTLGVVLNRHGAF